MDIVSSETAKKLKEAGFPQPEPEAGQVWYSAFRSAYVLLPASRVDFVRPASLDGGGIMDEGMHKGNLKDWLFAPTATDILRHLGYHEFIYYSESDEFGIGGSPKPYHANPAEAAAIEWL